MTDPDIKKSRTELLLIIPLIVAVSFVANVFMEKPFKEGVVIHKEIKKSEHYTSFIVTNNGYIPYNVENDELYIIKVRGINDRGTLLVDSYNVDKYQYDQIKIGSTYRPNTCGNY